MNTLLSLQSCFSRSLLDNNIDIIPYLSETEIPALPIYSNAYHIRLQETLKNDYPALTQLFSNDGFNNLATEYIRKHPSKSYSLRTFGESLSEFLSIEPSYRQQSYLAELAAFEWQLTDVFDLADSPIATVEDMSTIPAVAWPTLTVKLHASIRWLKLKWNISDIYPALKTNTEVPDLIKHSHQNYYIVWRKNYSPHYRLLKSNEWLALKVFEKNGFSELCITLSELNDEPENAPLEAATYLKSWLLSGLIESIKFTT